jgi:hypothetical protein
LTCSAAVQHPTRAAWRSVDNSSLTFEYSASSLKSLKRFQHFHTRDCVLTTTWYWCTQQCARQQTHMRVQAWQTLAHDVQGGAASTVALAVDVHWREHCHVVSKTADGTSLPSLSCVLAVRYAHAQRRRRNSGTRTPIRTARAQPALPTRRRAHTQSPTAHRPERARRPWR